MSAVCRVPVARALLPLLLVLLAGVACDSLPGKLRKELRAQEESLERARASVESARARLGARLAEGAPAAFLAPYAEREAWLDHFDAAGRELDHARELFTTRIDPILERNESQDAERLAAELARVASAISQGLAESARPEARLEQLLEAKQRGSELAREARGSLAQVGPAIAGLREKTAQAARDFDAKASDLQGRMAVVDQRVGAAEQAVGVAESRASAQQAGGGDLAELADGLVEARAALAAVEAAKADLSGKVGELYTSYAKTLIDMKSVYRVVIARTSWNDRADFATEHSHVFEPREVDEETLEYLETWGDRPIYRGRRPSVAAEVWRALALDPHEALPPGDDAVELWVEDSQEEYFHRYEYVEGDTRREGDWEPVSADFFTAHAEHLGMDIVAKPYGMYEEEALQEAMPPGLAFVGNPRYGRWESDGAGGQRWSWFESYLFYRLMFGGNHYYHYGPWGRWYGGYRGRRPYFGEGDRREYGTGGSFTRRTGRYANSSFGRSGGFDGPLPSVRGSGPAGRGGGPGGRGK